MCRGAERCRTRVSQSDLLRAREPAAVQLRSSGRHWTCPRAALSAGISQHPTTVHAAADVASVVALPYAGERGPGLTRIGNAMGWSQPSRLQSAKLSGFLWLGFQSVWLAAAVQHWRRQRQHVFAAWTFVF